MEGKPSDGLTIDYAPAGRNGTATLTARLAGEPIAVESFNLTKPKARAEFVAAVCNGRPGIDAAAVDKELLRIADKLTTDTPTAPQDLPELDTTAIIRPERFIRLEVSGLAVPTMAVASGRPVGRWLLYLQWADGRRELLTLPEYIDLADKRRLWIHPVPTEPTPTMQAGWSRHGRAEWLRGAPAPDPAELFRRLCERFAHFVDLPQAHAPGITATLVCWVVLTYSYSAWDAVPYLYVGGPLGSGKSRVFDILARLVFRALASSNLSAAAMFRTLHAQGGVLLLDEAERLRQTQAPEVSEILSMLLAGYKRGGTATRLEPVGDTFRTVAFDVFGPKALACIAGLPPALASRAIGVTMFRAAPGSEKPRRRIDADPAGWQRLRDDLHALALEHGRTWLELAKRVDVCPRMSGRDFELWQPVLAIASWIQDHGAGGLLGLMQAHALQTIEAGQDDQTPDTDETLLRILADAVRTGERLAPQDVLERARTSDADGFKTWKARGVVTVLKRYGLRTTKTHGRKLYAKVTPDDIAQIATSYGLDLGQDD
jgi:hypothetical protein